MGPITEVICPTCGAAAGERCKRIAPGTHTHQSRITHLEHTHARAFRIVSPFVHAQEKARRGIISQEAADAIPWRGPIARAVTLEDIEGLGLSVDLIQGAIARYHGSSVHVSSATIHGEEWVCYLEPRPGYLFISDGCAT